MVTSMKFGECLRYLLSTLDISIVKLSKAINLDTSLVNRWINEKRTPSYKTDYVDKISEYLSNCILNSFQMQYLDELYLKVLGDSGFELSPKEKIRKVLLQAQGYSLEYRKKIISEDRAYLISNKKDLKPIGFDHNYFSESNDDNINTGLLNIQDSDFLINLSSEDKLVIGYKNVLATSISLLEYISKLKCTNDTIYISFNNNMLMPYYKNDLLEFRDAMLKTINSGWTIHFYLKLNNNINNLVTFIDFVQPLIVTGKFHPYYFKKYDTSSTFQEFIVIPKIAVLVGLSNNLNSEIDTAFYFRNVIAINILKNKIDSIITNHASSLVKYYKSYNTIDYSNFIAEQENVIGNRILFKRDFGLLTLSESLYRKLLQKSKIDADELNISLEFYDKRLKAFLSNIHNYKYTDIYHIDCINNLIKYGEFNLYLYNKVLTVKLNIEEVIEILNNIVIFLKKYKNYNIAFISHNFKISNFVFYCMVKERTAVAIETYDYTRDIPIVRLSTREPLIVTAFETYFNEVLDHIDPMNKDKDEVITWIERQINMLKNHQ